MEEWLAEDEHHQALLQDWKSCSTIRQKTEAYERLKYSEAWEDFRKARQEKMSLLRRKRWNMWMKYAALFVVPLSVAVVLLWNNTEKSKELQVAESIVNPGKSQAVLVLSSGERQALDEEERSFKDGGMTIKAQSGEINYANQVQKNAKNASAFHTLEVPRGGGYFMVLADGTKVWLNAATRLSYPVAFWRGSTKGVSGRRSLF